MFNYILQQSDSGDPAAIESRLATLNQEISRLNSIAAEIKKKRAPVMADASIAAWWLRYIKMAKWIRAPGMSYPFWRIGLLLAGPSAIGAICLVVVDLFVGSLYDAVFVAVLVAIASVVALSILLYLPNKNQLAVTLVQAEERFQLADERLRLLTLTDGLTTIEEHLRESLIERREQKRKLRDAHNSQQRLRVALLHRNWRAMRGYQWEEYLLEVCHALGAKAWRIGGAGDQGVDLIIEYGLVRIAIQAKGYEDAVNNKAVQEVYAGMIHHRCNACAVITNSRFRKSALEIADSTCCILIGEDEFPDFVLGRLELKETAMASAVRYRMNN